MNKIKCKSCGELNYEDAYFCKACGKSLGMRVFENKNIESASEFKLSRIAANLKENPHTEILWNDTINEYSRKVERIESLLRIKDIGLEADELNEKVDKFLRLCRKPDFEIAFVGAVKAGKSTLINALLGKNYASTDPNPETAVLTKFRSSEQDYVKVTFYSEDEWNELWKTVEKAERFLELYRELDGEKHKKDWIGHDVKYIELKNEDVEKELSIWSSSKKCSSFFVKEIEVGISTLAKSFPKQVVFVDTPGLSDPVAYRSRISDQYIRTANAVLVCVIAKNLIDEEVKTVEKVMAISSHKKNKVFVIATQWDDLNDPVQDWNKRKDYLSKIFTGNAFYPTREMAMNNIMYSSAYMYNLCRNYSKLERKERNKVNILPMKLDMDVELGRLTQSDIQKLMDITNIQNINQVIVDELVTQYSTLLFEDIRLLYEDILHKTKLVAGERKKTLSERISISNKELKDVEEKLAESKKNMDDIQQCQKQLQVALSSLEKSTQSRLNSILSQME